MPSPLRIRYLITGLDVGGAELALARLVSRLDRRRFDVDVITLLEPGPVAARVEAAGVSVSTLGMRPGAPSPAAVLRLRRLLRRRGCDLLETWMYHADLLGGLVTVAGGTPRLVWNLRASQVEQPEYGWTFRAVRRACAALSRLPRAIVANSSAGQRVHQGLGYRARRWVVIPNGFDTERFRPSGEDRQQVRAELGIPAGAPLVAVVARLDPIKGHQDFVRTWPGLPDHVHLMLAGQGVGPDAPLFAQAMATRPDLPRRVHLLGLRHDVPRLLAAADLVCCPSRAEGFPNAVGEAMAAGVPCVVTDVGDVRALVRDSGWVVPPGDVAALGHALHAALADAPEERARRGRLARRIVEADYSLAAMTGRYEALYDSLTASGAGAPATQ